MANWEKLNKEFDDLLDNLTDEDLDNWMSSRQEKKKIRRDAIVSAANLHQHLIYNGIILKSTTEFQRIGIYIDNDNSFHCRPPSLEDENILTKNSPIVDGAIFFK